VGIEKSQFAILKQKYSLLENDIPEFAKQLALIAQELFLAIQPQEFLYQAWVKKYKEKKAPNVLACIRNFNKISMWCVSEVLHCADLQLRKNVIRKLIQLAAESEKLNNFDTTTAIVAALQNTCVFRLKKTWEDLGKEYDEMYATLQPYVMSNPAKIKEKIKNISPPCIPYLGLYLTDITYLEEMPDKYENLINFSKYQKIADTIFEIQQYNNDLYLYKLNPEFQTLITNFEALPDKDLYTLSVSLEKRDSHT